MQRRIKVLRAAVKKYVRCEFIIMAIHYKDFLKINQSKSASAKGDVPKIFVHPLHPCYSHSPLYLKVRSHKESKVPCQGHKCSDLYCTLYDFIRTSKNIHQMSPSRMFLIRVRKNLSVEEKWHLRQIFSVEIRILKCYVQITQLIVKT